MRLTFVVFIALSAFLSGCKSPSGSPTSTESPAAASSPSQSDLAFEGTHLFEKTYEKVPQVKAKLHCSSCHLQGGTAAGAASLVGIGAHYPQQSRRAGREINLADRVNECFERSLNGPGLPVESREMKALLAYIDGLTVSPRPTPGLKAVKTSPAEASSDRGQVLFATQCASCHKADGSGTYKDGAYLYPALWGDQSFTSGSDMAQTKNLAAFIAVKMPLGQGRTLTVQEVWDIAAYVAGQPRPAWPSTESSKADTD
jgi:thiosulfate dehydrogenase